MLGKRLLKFNNKNNEISSSTGLMVLPKNSTKAKQKNLEDQNLQQNQSTSRKNANKTNIDVPSFLKSNDSIEAIIRPDFEELKKAIIKEDQVSFNPKNSKKLKERKDVRKRLKDHALKEKMKLKRKQKEIDREQKQEIIPMTSDKVKSLEFEENDKIEILMAVQGLGKKHWANCARINDAIKKRFEGIDVRIDNCGNDSIIGNIAGCKIMLVKGEFENCVYDKLVEKRLSFNEEFVLERIGKSMEDLGVLL